MVCNVVPIIFKCPQSPEKYILKFAAGTLPQEPTNYVVDYKFSDGSSRHNISVEVLAPDVLLVYHPG